MALNYRLHDTNLVGRSSVDDDVAMCMLFGHEGGTIYDSCRLLANTAVLGYEALSLAS